MIMLILYRPVVFEKLKKQRLFSVWGAVKLYFMDGEPHERWSYMRKINGIEASRSSLNSRAYI